MIKNVIVLTLSLKFDGFCIAAYDASNNQALSRKVCKFIYESLDLNVAHSWG